MTRVEFILSMPGRKTWDGRWSGDDRHHAIVRELDAESARRLDASTFAYAWPDGWVANVTARIVAPDAKLKKSAGFCGYDWMVDSIIRYGSIYAAHEIPKKIPVKVAAVEKLSHVELPCRHCGHVYERGCAGHDPDIKNPLLKCPSCGCPHDKPIEPINVEIIF